MTIEIPLTKGYVAIIDDEDAHLAEFKWSARVHKNGTVYANRTHRVSEGFRGPIGLHRCVMGLLPGDPMVDHIDGDGLNCRRSNLRLANNKINGRNLASGARKHNKASPYLGVHQAKNDGKFVAQIRVNGKAKHLGRFHTAEDANVARLKAERELWGIQPRRAKAHGEEE